MTITTRSGRILLEPSLVVHTQIDYVVLDNVVNETTLDKFQKLGEKWENVVQLSKVKSAKDRGRKRKSGGDTPNKNSQATTSIPT